MNLKNLIAGLYMTAAASGAAGQEPLNIVNDIDLDRDGKNELVMINSEGMEVTRQGRGESTQLYRFFGDKGKVYQHEDMNGDGIADLYAVSEKGHQNYLETFSSQKPEEKTNRFSKQGFNGKFNYNHQGILIPEGATPEFRDVDGDGLVDIVANGKWAAQGENGFLKTFVDIPKKYQQKQTSKKKTKDLSPYEHSSIDRQGKIIYHSDNAISFGEFDINNDGKNDHYTLRTNNDKNGKSSVDLAVLLSKEGTGHAQQTINLPHSSEKRGEAIPYVVFIDVNKDGLKDLVYSPNHKVAEPQMYIGVQGQDGTFKDLVKHYQH